MLCDYKRLTIGGGDICSNDTFQLVQSHVTSLWNQRPAEFCIILDDICCIIPLLSTFIATCIIGILIILVILWSHVSYFPIETMPTMTNTYHTGQQHIPANDPK
jgi:hypothetical protein